MADSINDRKTLLISGASSGIGHAVCKRLASSETQVFTVDIECAPPDVEVANHYQADLSVPAEVEKLTRTIRNDIDISSISSLINVAHDIVLLASNGTTVSYTHLTLPTKA